MMNIQLSLEKTKKWHVKYNNVKKTEATLLPKYQTL